MTFGSFSCQSTASCFAYFKAEQNISNTSRGTSRASFNNANALTQIDALTSAQSDW